MADDPQQPPSGKDARRQAKVDLAAAKARAKAEKPFWKKWWFILGAIILVIAVASSVGTGDGNDTTGGSDSSSEDGESAGVGDAVADGDFTFTVTDFECGETKIGKGPFASEASGEFCVATVNVENIGDESGLMDSSSQYLYIGDKEYSADSDAVLASSDAQNFFLEEINPGLSVDGIIVWDIPEGESPDYLELHDSPFSGGVRVNL